MTHTDSTMPALQASAYAPYRDPRDYILSWTDAIWVDRGLGRLREHYDREVKVHTAYGETYDYDYVMQNSLQKFAAFPNGGGGTGEDVIWEQRGANGFISSHRVFKSGTHTGYWTYGPPTGRDLTARPDVLGRDNFDATLARIGCAAYDRAIDHGARSPFIPRKPASSRGGLAECWNSSRPSSACPTPPRRSSVS